MKIVHQGLAAFLLSGASLAHAVPHYSVTALAPIGSSGYSINNAGTAVARCPSRAPGPCCWPAWPPWAPAATAHAA